MFLRAARLLAITLLTGLFLLPVASFAAEGDAALTTASGRAGGLFVGVTQACWDDGLCTLCDALVVFINVANGILRLLAIVATIFFVYGAGLMMLSQGNEDMVSRGKAAMKATVVGTIIVLTAWQLMSVVVFVLSNQALSAAGGNKTTYNPISAWYDAANKCGQVNEARTLR